MKFKAKKSNYTRAIVYCHSEIWNNKNFQQQENSMVAYAETQGYTVTETFIESGKMDSLTYNCLRLRAKYREFDVLLISELETLGNSPIEIMHEVKYLTDHNVQIISIKEGEINAETLPLFFRKCFYFVK